MSEVTKVSGTSGNGEDATVDSLWPGQFDTATFTPPITVLRQQALKLREVTGGVLEGEAATDENDGGTMIHSFFIVAPRLNRYRFHLLSLMHRADSPYPVQVWYEAPSRDASRAEEASWEEVFKNSNLRDETRLKERLKEIFSSDATRKLIESLLAQSQEPVAV
jgi:hypothetical protein